MPQVSQFSGISVRINYADHPPPHLHAYYGGRHVMVDISAGTILRGSFPPAQEKRLLPWVTRHRTELDHAWALASQQQQPPWIPSP